LAGKILILSSGGGHTGYAHILAEALAGRAELLFLVPDDDRLSRSRLEPYGLVKTLVKPRHPTTPLWSFTFRMTRALWRAPGLVPKDVDVVVGTGNNFCIAPSLAAWMKGIPVVYLESRVRFTSPSRTAAILHRFSKVTALQWEEQRRFLDGTVFGPLLPQRRIEPWDGGYVLVAGGTYGYKELFDAFAETALKNVVLQTGDLDPAPYKEKRPEWRVISYTDKFDELLAGAEVVVCPPGGTPVEAMAYGKPVVIVRYPSWTRAAGPEDTRLFAEKLNAPLLDSFTPKDIEEAIIKAKSRTLPELVNGTEALVEAILNL